MAEVPKGLFNDPDPITLPAGVPKKDVRVVPPAPVLAVPSDVGSEAAGLVSDDNPYGKPDGCRACGLFREPGIVQGSGNRSARILFVAEAPGAEEVSDWRIRTGRTRPLVGGAGRLLSKLLEHSGLDRDRDMFVSNCVKCRPPGNRLPTDGEVACCARFLIREIEEVDPAVIIAAGELALNVLTNKKKIGLWRGVPTAGPSFARADGSTRTYKVFPTWHPAFIARAQYNWPFAVHDLARAKTESTFEEIRRIPINIIRNADVGTHGDALLRSARERGAITFDYETTGLHAKYDQILMSGFVARPDQGEVYDWTLGTQRLFQEILDDPRIEICGQNILYFDLPLAEAKGQNIDSAWSRVFDTLVAFHLCNSSYGQTSVSEQKPGGRGPRGAEKDLAFIASNHTDIEYWKSREMYGSDLKGVCGIDCIATDRSAYHPTEGLKAELRRYDMEDLYWKHVLPVHPVIHRMNRRGIKFDQEQGVLWSYALKTKAEQLTAALREGLNAPYLNLNSPQQLMKLLYDDMGLAPQYIEDKKRGRRRTANKEAVEKLAELYPENKIVASIATIRHLEKMDSTYVQPGLESEDGKLHPRFGVSKASTGRFNSWDPNEQNVPEEMRILQIPDDEDCVLLSADWSQIEWRLAMILSGDPVGLALLTSGEDIHTATASETLGLKIADVTDAIRHRSKFIVYGLGYGRGASSIASANGWEMSFVNNFIQSFFSRFRVFGNWRDGNVKYVKENHYLKNAFKRRRWWYTWEVTEVYNFPQQSTAADMMYEILVAQERQLPKDSSLRLTVHDEVVINAPKDRKILTDTISCVKETMERAWPEIVEASANPDIVKQYYPNGWFCPSDIHIGTNWRMCKSKDPNDKKARAELCKQLGVAHLIN